MEKFISIAIHTSDKALLLKNTLETEGIEVYLEEVYSPSIIGVKVSVKHTDLPKALGIIESRNLFSYSNNNTLIKDDKRKRVLVPVDFSEYSMQACSFAFNLAKNMNAKVKIIHIYFNPFYPNTFLQKQDSNKEYESIEEKVKENIQKLCNDIDTKIESGEYPSVNYSYFIKEGLPEEEIVLFADDYKPELIIMGTRGKDEKDGDLIGSVTANVIEMTHFPIIAIPHNTSFTTIELVKKISFLTNFSQRDILAFDKMIQTIQHCDFLFEIVHVSTNEKEKWSENKKVEVKSYFTSKYPGLRLSFRQIEVDDFLTGLDTYIRNEQVDVLALTTSKRNVFMRMFRPSISRKMLYHSSTPLFVLRG